MDRTQIEALSGGTIRQLKYLKRNPVRRFLITRFLDTIGTWIEESGAARIGDIGAGEGFVAQHILQLPKPPSGRTIRSAIDIDTGVLRVARYLNPGLPVVSADAQRCPIKDRAFDLVLCNEVLEHVRAPDNLLAELCRIAPMQIISIPHEPGYRWANLAIGANWQRRGDDPDHLNRWSPPAFRAFLSRRVKIVALKISFPWTLALCRNL